MERRPGRVLELRVDLEAPGEVGRLAVELLVPPVAQPAEALGEQQARCEAVGQEPDVGACPLGDDAPDEAAEGDSAPDPEASLPDRERAPPLLGHLVPARDDVVQARPHDPGGDTPDRAAEDEVPVAAARNPAPAGHVDTQRDRREQGQPVHVHRERPEVERAGARRGDREEDAQRRRILRARTDRLVPGCTRHPERQETSGP